MANFLQGKHIVLGVTGGIAAYKAAVLTRLLVKAGAEVQPVMTAAVEEATLSCPLARKPLASRTMNTPIQVAWIQSLRSGRIQRPVNIRNSARRMPPMTMRLPPTRKGPATPRLNL